MEKHINLSEEVLDSLINKIKELEELKVWLRFIV